MSRPAPSVPNEDSTDSTHSSSAARKPRSLSDGNSNSEFVDDLRERMKYTRDFNVKGFKGNSRGHSVQAPFTTLEEMFKRLPESISFNIEMSTSNLLHSLTFN